MAGRTKRLAKAVAVLATTAAVKQVVQRAAEDPRVRRKAARVGAAVQAKARAAGRAAGKRATLLAQDAGSRVGKKLAGPRKVAGKKIKRLGKLVAG